MMAAFGEPLTNTTMRLFLFFLLFTTSVFGQSKQLKDAYLYNALDANAQDILDVGEFSIGAGTPTGRIHILPNGTPTTAADGIKIGSDISIFRSGAAALTIDSDVVVTGSFTLDGQPLGTAAYGDKDTTSKMVWVSKDATATDTRTGLNKYDQFKPFATIQAAVTAAASGDTVKVNPGDYDETVTAKNGVALYFNAGARVVKTGGLSALVIPTGVSCTVAGYGEFITTGAESAVYTVSLEGTGAVTLMADLIYNQADSNLSNAGGLYTTKATAYVHLNDGSLSKTYDGIVIEGGTNVFIEAQRAIGGGSDAGVELAIGGAATNVTLDIRKIGYDADNGGGADALIVSGGSGLNLKVFNAHINSVGNSGINVGGDTGTLDFLGCVIHSNDFQPPINVSQTSGTVRMFGGRTFTEDQQGTPVNYAITGTGSIDLHGVYVDKPVDSGVTVSGSYTVEGQGIVSGTSVLLDPGIGAINFGQDGAAGTMKMEGGSLIVEGSVDANEMTISFADLAADYTVSFNNPGAAAALMYSLHAGNAPHAVSSLWFDANLLIAEGTSANAGEMLLSFNLGTTSSDKQFNLNAATTATQALVASTLSTNAEDVANSVWMESNVVAFEGATEDSGEFRVINTVDVGSDRFVNLNNPSSGGGAFVYSLLTTNAPDVGNSVWMGSNSINFEVTNDGNEVALTAADPTGGDTTWTIPAYTAGSYTFANLQSAQTFAGAMTFGASIELPATSSSTVGVINQGGSRIMHSYGTSNLWLGPGAGNFTLSGTNNVGIGSVALDALTSGGNNVALGEGALTLLTSGSTNVAIGRLSGDGLTIQSSNVSIGTYSMRGTGAANTAVGTEAIGGQTASSADSNTAIGSRALYALTTGDQNIAIGRLAGDAITTGSSNIVIGYDLDVPTPTASNQVNIGGIFTSDGTTTTLTQPVNVSGALSSGGNVQAGAAALFYWTLRSVIASPGDGVIRLTNNAQTDFSRLQLGGTTSSFPAIKRNGAAVDIRLADDSASAALNAATITGSTVISTGTLQGGQNAAVATANRWMLSGPSDGVIRATNIAGTDFGRLQLGGTTSAFPSIKRNGTGIDFRLADDSAYAPVVASTYSGLTINLPGSYDSTDKLVTAASTGAIRTDVGAATSMTLTPTTSQTNANINVYPKGGTGSFNMDSQATLIGVGALNFQMRDTIGGAQTFQGARGTNSIAMGWGNIASDYASTAVGTLNLVTGQGNLALGSTNLAVFEQSIAVGNNNTSAGIGSLALGNYNYAGGSGSVAIGSGAAASSDFSFATGNGAAGHAIGWVTAPTSTTINYVGSTDLRDLFRAGDLITVSGMWSEGYYPTYTSAATDGGAGSQTNEVVSVTVDTITVTTPLASHWQGSNYFQVFNRTAEKGYEVRANGAIVEDDSIGYARRVDVVLAQATLDDTPVAFTQLTPGENTQFRTRPNCSYKVQADILGRRSDGVSNSYSLEAIVVDVAGVVTVQGSVLGDAIEGDADWAADIVADDANNAFIIQITGDSALTVHWVGNIRMLEVGYVAVP